MGTDCGTGTGLASGVQWAVPETASPGGRCASFEVKAVAKYADGMRNSGLSVERRAEIVERYRVGRGRLREFECRLSAVTRNMPDAGQAEKQRLFSMGQRVYGLRRRRSASEVLKGVVVKAGELAATGVGLRPVMEVVSWCLTTLGIEFDAGALQTRIRKEAAFLGGNMSGSQEAAVRSGNGEVTKSEATNPGRVAELTAKVEDFLAGRLANRAEAEELARDIVGLIVAVEAKPAREQRKAASARGELPESSLVNEPTSLDRYRKRNATAELRLALAGHQTIVKDVVVERLSRHTGLADLAEKFGLTMDEVTDILTRMRAWVKRFTEYYDKDWYWLDGTAKYFIPDPPKCEAELKAAAGS